MFGWFYTSDTKKIFYKKIKNYPDHFSPFSGSSLRLFLNLLPNCSGTFVRVVSRGTKERKVPPLHQRQGHVLDNRRSTDNLRVFSLSYLRMDPRETGEVNITHSKVHLNSIDTCCPFPSSKTDS